ncbi:MAG: glutamine-hydrolyzing carbamoyl-phosphate synthase small subunit [Bacteroidetes bacterium]|nr:glutamine-hydrolyzing carbamoyl-phosphate synthase small subunit [Bacteroidota bacterium]MDA0875085.1 glutamine-hydrolyzing carbamoyl-phosphate synthase small subunit [Bacteroidota bacterium]
MINPQTNDLLLTPAPCKLALADGTVVTGKAVGFRGETGGELCFNTSMTGYQEIFTDPSYHGQIMMMTYPHIGNYGTMDIDMEASRPMVSGVVVRAFSPRYSNQLTDQSLDAFMKKHQLVGISEIDTRALVLHIREKGVMNAVISSVDLDDASLVEKARNWPSMDGLELASRVTIKEAYDFSTGKGPRIAVYDFGVKQNILRSFKARGCSVRVFPAATPLGEVLAWKPDGLFFSNGPGDPRAMPEAIAMTKEAMQSGIPLFGICLGHQLLSLAAGLDVYKMYVGHRGANHPVQNLDTGHVEVSTQNHGFAVDKDSITDDKARVTHVNLNDNTIEGLRYATCTAFSVQYHPEASPGPHDSQYLFDTFMKDIEEHSGVAPTHEPSPEMIYAGGR